MEDIKYLKDWMELTDDEQEAIGVLNRCIQALEFNTIDNYLKNYNIIVNSVSEIIHVNNMLILKKYNF